MFSLAFARYLFNKCLPWNVAFHSEWITKLCWALLVELITQINWRRFPTANNAQSMVHTPRASWIFELTDILNARKIKVPCSIPLQMISNMKVEETACINFICSEYRSELVYVARARAFQLKRNFYRFTSSSTRFVPSSFFNYFQSFWEVQ